MSWNYCEVIDQIGQGALASRPALIHGESTINFRELRHRAQGIGAWLQSLELPTQSHVGHYMRNSNAYMETFLGSGLIGFSHVNVNYRYQDQELVDLCNALDLRVLVYDSEFADIVANIKPRLPKTVAFVEVTEASPQNNFAVALRTLYDFPTQKLTLDTDDNNKILIATGGTTGLPKGTEWLHTDLWHKMAVWSSGILAAVQWNEPPRSVEEYLRVLSRLEPSPPLFPMCPLMHGTGLLMALSALAQGSPVVTTDNPRFDPDDCLRIIAEHQVGWLVIVGDAFAIPLLESIERSNNNAFDSVKAVVSSGAILSSENKARLNTLRDDILLIDTLGSTEAIGFGAPTAESGVFDPMPTTRVFDDEMNEVKPGSGDIGIAYSGGYTPIGYYKSPEKSAETFVEVDGQRYVKTGDRCTVRADGKLVLLGRDSTVINTGGEKVYTVEVERELVNHPRVSDAVVVGLPHPRFGKMVVAIVEGQNLTAETLNAEEIRSYLLKQLADYKVPRRIYAIPSVERLANGKVNYPFINGYAEDCLAGEE